MGFCGINLCLIALKWCIFAGIFAYIYWYLCKTCTNAKTRLNAKNARDIWDYMAQICVAPPPL